MTSHLLPALRRTVAAALAASALGAAPAVLASESPEPAAARDQQPSTPPRPTDRRGGPRDGVEVVDREVRTLAIGPGGALELSTLAGDITVVAGPGKDARVEIVRRARAATESDAKTGLSEVQVKTENQGDRVIVGVVTPRRPSVPVRVNVSYSVTAPAGIRLSASAVNGNIDVKGIKGEVAAQATSGNVTIADAGGTDAIEITGTPVKVSRDLVRIEPTDVVVVFDLRRYERWLLEATARAADTGAKLIALTDGRLSPLAERAELTFVVAARGVGPFDSAVGAMSLVNALIAAVASRLRRSATGRLDAVEESWRAGTDLVEQ